MEQRQRLRRQGSLALGLAIVGALVTAGCNEPNQPGRVLLVGIDGASLRVIEPMLRRGRLPNLGALAKRGVHGKLRSQEPIDSPPIWNTIATGMVPKKHGIPSFAYKDDSGEKHLFLSTDRKVPAVWNIISAAGHSVGVVNFWNTYPPDRLDGVMISDHVLAREVAGRAMISKAPTPSDGTTVFPAAWAARIGELLDVEEPLASVANPFRDNPDLPKWVLVKDLIRRYEEDAALARIAIAIEAEVRPDLMMVLLPGIDRVSHHLWGNLEPAELYPPRLRPTEAERKAGAKALRSYYRYVDELVGLLLRNYTEKDLVMVISDHGFEAGTALMKLTGKHETEGAIEGVIFAAGRGVRPPGGEAVAVSVRDITPTILAWFGIPIGADMDGRLMPFLKTAKRPAQIESHQSTPVEKVTAAPSGVEKQIIERLEAIGYMQD